MQNGWKLLSRKEEQWTIDTRLKIGKFFIRDKHQIPLFISLLNEKEKRRDLKLKTPREKEKKYLLEASRGG